MKLVADLWQTGDTATVARGVLAAKEVWGEDLNEIDGLTQLLTSDLQLIQTKGMRAAVEEILK